MANKMSLEFEGFDELINRLKEVEADITQVTEKALAEAHSIITAKAAAAIAPHKRTGRTEASLEKNVNVSWNSTTASIDVGFHIREGGLASIFLMYGTPRMKKDTKLYNAIFGNGTKSEVAAAEEQILFDELRKLGG